MIYRAKVTRVNAEGAFVTIARLAGAHEFGPLEVVEGPWTEGLESQAGEAGPESHTHGLGVDLDAGDRVLVAAIEGRRDDFVVVGRLP